MNSPLTHFDAHGQAHMVDVSAKNPTHRVATATGTIRMETPRLEVTGDIVDQADGTGVSMGDMRTAYNIHTHPTHAPVPPAPQMVAP